MRAATAALAAALLLSGWHIIVPLAGYPVAVPLPALAVVAELAVIAALGWLIARAWRRFPSPSSLSWSTA